MPLYSKLSLAFLFNLMLFNSDLSVQLLYDMWYETPLFTIVQTH